MEEYRHSRRPRPGERAVNALRAALCVISLLVLLGVGFYSLVDADNTVSTAENRALAAKPKFSLSALFNGSYISKLDTYYSDQFPMRDSFLSANRSLNQFYYYGGTSSDSQVLTITHQGGAEAGGEALRQTDTNAPGSETETTEPTQESTEDDSFDNGVTDADASLAGSVLIVGDRAMEIPYASDDVIKSYADAVNNIQQAVSSNIRVFSLVTPNSGEFYSPEDYHTGSNSQKDMIDYCYSQMNDKVITVNAYSALRKHMEEYIYFRTDHHWTALGAYYAYTAYCSAAGLTPVALSSFQTGELDNFLGSLYTATSNYSQSDALRNNPDKVIYYKPIADVTETCYADSTLTNPSTWQAVISYIGDSVSNKYLCFLGGDNPITVLDTDVKNGKVCMILKESYGNAFTPFLTSHYSKVIAIDPREFNRDGKPSLDLASFAAQMNVNDLIILNYPYMINNSSYISWLNRLVGKS